MTHFPELLFCPGSLLPTLLWFLLHDVWLQVQLWHCFEVLLLLLIIQILIVINLLSYQ